MPWFETLLALGGVATVMVVYTAFGTNYVKPTVFVHDSPTLHRLDVPPPSPPVKTVELRGWVRVDGARVARTYLAQSYPPVLASWVARGTARQCSYVRKRGQRGGPRQKQRGMAAMAQRLGSLYCCISPASFYKFGIVPCCVFMLCIVYL